MHDCEERAGVIYADSWFCKLSNYVTILGIDLLPRAHVQGVKQSVCMSVVVVRTKITSLGDLGP